MFFCRIKLAVTWISASFGSAEGRLMVLVKSVCRSEFIKLA